MPVRTNGKQVAGTYVFGILIFAILATVVLFGGGADAQARGQIIRVLCAAGAGLAGSFISGTIVVKNVKLPGWWNVPITATGGFAIFLVVFYGWGGAPSRTDSDGGPLAPTNTPSSVVHVRIVDGDQRPIPNVTVLMKDAILKANAQGELDVPISAFASGRIQMVDVLAEGFTTQSARLDGNEPGVQTLTMSAKAKEVTIQARIVDEENKPRTTRWVTLIGGPKGPQKGLTGSDGIVRFNLPAGVSRGSLKIEVDFLGYEQQLVPMGLSDDLIQIKLVARHMKVQITVVDQQTGRPLPGAQVEVLAISTMLTGTDGRCSFDINLGKWSKVLVRVTKNGYEFGSLEIPIGPSTERVIQLRRGLSAR